MNVLVSGATGMIGVSLTRALESAGHKVTRLTRSPKSDKDIGWDPDARRIDGDLSGTEAVVHLAGESIAEGRWNEGKKSRILDSRVKGTKLLAESVARLAEPPRVMVSASATGYYGDRGNELLTEESEPGTSFLARVCQEWEAAADPAREAGVRVVHPRLGIVLSTEGGALSQTLPIFKLGGGGKIGSGDQYWSWISLDDVTGAILHAINTETINGPMNVTAPEIPTNSEYTKTLGKVLGRPTFVPLPAPAARIALGEVADALLLASTRVEPAKLKETSYEYKAPNLEGAFRHLLGR
jgi:uncharacterized protein (TIGR01777 family)